MKNSKSALKYALLAIMLCCTVQPAFARKLKNEIKGVYSGRVTGGISILHGTLQEFSPVNITGSMLVGGNTSVVLSPTQRPVSVRGRSRIRRGKATFIGRYYGTFENPNNDQIEHYSGTRRGVIRRRTKRLVMQYTDRLVEGTLSGWFLKGTLSKPRKRR